ncbi:NAD-dependent malic enzyme [Candidatus Micrarchaeota archaeon]|nr:MAG: NAD-dependent malic enzyme [Candidatus Micrarchaeota archaeon]
MQAKALRIHAKTRGKVEVKSKVSVRGKRELSAIYTPGVAEVCRAIARRKSEVYKYTNRWNSVAIVTDGTRVLGLGDIGPEAALPVMEGKAVIYKKFGGIDAYSICLATRNADEIVRTVKALEPNYAAINLEDIASPKCFEIYERLERKLSIPVYHDDQHGTAVIALAGLKNALKFVGKGKGARTVVNGAGAAGYGIANLLLHAGYKNLIVCDSKGALYKGRRGMNRWKAKLAGKTNSKKMKGGLKKIITGADVFIGASAPNILSESMVRSMASQPIIFALANPEPEIKREKARKAGAHIYATGRSDLPNQINNATATPGLLRGALDARARKITPKMMIAAADAIAKLVGRRSSADYIVPKLFDKRIAPAVARAVRRAAR